MVVKTFSDGEAWQVAYLASRTIFPGDQLLVDYGDEFWRERAAVPRDLTNTATTTATATTYPSMFEMVSPVDYFARGSQCPHDPLLSPFHRFVNDDLEEFFGIRSIYRNVSVYCAV